MFLWGGGRCKRVCFCHDLFRFGFKVAHGDRSSSAITALGVLAERHSFLFFAIVAELINPGLAALGYVASEGDWH